MSSRTSIFRSSALRNSVLIASVFVLSACAEGQMPAFLQNSGNAGEETVARAATSGATSIERDIEAPEIFQAKEAGLWDGRPSLGGVWVAHPDVKDPERVIIRNEQNGKFVIGALFRREREAPGPRVQVSSDAASAIGMLAGQPANLDVIALRREELPAQAEALAAPVANLDAPSDVSAQPLDPVVSGAAAAIETAALKPTEQSVITPAEIKPTPVAAVAPTPKASRLAKPFVQIGIFSVEQNAKNTATAMRQAGMVPTIKKHSSKGKTFWRVVVGPAQTKDELATLITKIKGTGFTDAYAVSN